MDSQEFKRSALLETLSEYSQSIYAHALDIIGQFDPKAKLTKTQVLKENSDAQMKSYNLAATQQNLFGLRQNVNTPFGPNIKSGEEINSDIAQCDRDERDETQGQLGLSDIRKESQLLTSPHLDLDDFIVPNEATNDALEESLQSSHNSSKEAQKLGSCATPLLK